MSSRLMAEVFEAKNYPAEEKMFLMVLANNANDFGFGEISFLDLASSSGLPTDRCLALLDELVATTIFTYEWQPKRDPHGNYEVERLQYRLKVWSATGNEESQK